MVELLATFGKTHCSKGWAHVLLAKDNYLRGLSGQVHRLVLPTDTKTSKLNAFLARVNLGKAITQTLWPQGERSHYKQYHCICMHSKCVC